MKINTFKTRKELDSFVANAYGTDAQANKKRTVTVRGSTEELRRLHLKDGKQVFGIKVKDTSVKDKVKKTFINTKEIR